MIVTVSDGSAITGLELASGGSGSSTRMLNVGVLTALGQEFKAKPQLAWHSACYLPSLSHQTI